MRSWTWFALSFAALSVSQSGIAGEEYASSTPEDDHIVAIIRYNTDHSSKRSCNGTETVYSDVRIYADGRVTKRDKTKVFACPLHPNEGSVPVYSLKKEKLAHLPLADLPSVLDDLGRLAIEMHRGPYDQDNANAVALGLGLSPVAGGVSMESGLTEFVQVGAGTQERLNLITQKILNVLENN
jgi:hypothetical protein